MEGIGEVKKSFTVVAKEAETLAGIRPVHLLQRARKEGLGVTINKVDPGQGGLILLSGFFGQGNQLRLIRRDGSIVSRWPVKFSEIFPETQHLSRPPETDWNIDLHGALALPDGSVVFNFEYGGLVKLNRFGGVVWTVKRQTHHSVEPAAGGGFWVCCRKFHPPEVESPFPPFPTPFYEDIILRVSPDGEILKEVSVPKLFYQNGLEALLTARGESIRRDMVWGGEPTHLNSIKELSPETAPCFPMFEAGDLLLSLRQHNMLAVFSPESGKMKWWKIGPWIRQHDPEFGPGGWIYVFNNNVYRTAFGLNKKQEDRCDPGFQGTSNILRYNPATGDHEIVYGRTEAEKLLSALRGKIEMVGGRGLLITEFEGGRVFEIDETGEIVWEYINRFDSEFVAELTEARLYPPGYFKVEEWRR